MQSISEVRFMKPEVTRHF